MRYIRFLKTPRIVHEKNSPKTHISCLITITSDLGDSFLPQDITLSAELLHVGKHGHQEDVVLWKSVTWTSGMRVLPITLPLSKSHNAWPLRVRIGVAPKSEYDNFGELVEERGWRGVVSAWSGLVDVTQGVEVAENFVKRRFDVGVEGALEIFEETGESIARHLWDAGITLACHIKSILSENEMFAIKDGSRSFRVVELGTGCGIVGLTIAKTVPNSKVILTDLAEAREIVERNISLSQSSPRGSVEFKELDWEKDIPELFSNKSTSCARCKQVDLVVAADCTYNADSSPSLVNTIEKIARTSSSTTIMIAMKKRHSSENVFFDLMAATNFRNTRTCTYQLPGDEQTGEETVEVYFYRYGGAEIAGVEWSEDCECMSTR
ncbi:hypothetical protein P280DRAFT_417219 [Massarina eburnea CBS 473.64]|uniref:Methyltransferase-domain-containing protein n=1 Tax=Massarina eburnea CBS 473.64 TaxID=1395130 RepID=A0A6A6SGV1_9PLEO|nr:hypothetical protein P280DRAFT_417219 [Massarina eburnea CBS 473.64]